MNPLVTRLRITFRCLSQRLKVRSLKKVLCLIVGLSVVHLLFIIFALHKYHELPSLKKDLRIRQIILSRFPPDYDVSIKVADLIGLGDCFYVAGGNKSYVSHAYAYTKDGEDPFKTCKGQINYPIVKFFYVREPGFLSAIFSVIPFLKVEAQCAELSVKEYYSFSPIPVTLSTELVIAEQRSAYHTSHEYPSTFSLFGFSILDLDSDGQEEVVTTWLDYSGGSGGTKWSVICDFTGGTLKMSTGYPDLLNIEFSKCLWAIVRYSGLLKPSQRDEGELIKVMPVLRQSGVTEAESKKILRNPPQRQEIDSILKRLSSLSSEGPDKFLNLCDGKVVEVYARHTDDYGTFLKVDDRFVFAEAYYILDSACHWCEHTWRIMSFLSHDGRWISDRTVNGSTFDGDWLAEDRKFTLNDVFGTYADQGPFGIAWSFLNSDWTGTSKYGISDPYGVEMRLTSPVERRIRAIYRAMDKWP